MSTKCDVEHYLQDLSWYPLSLLTVFHSVFNTVKSLRNPENDLSLSRSLLHAVHSPVVVGQFNRIND